MGGRENGQVRRDRRDTGSRGKAANGQTLALVTVNQAVFNSYLFSKLPYDPLQISNPSPCLLPIHFPSVQKSFWPNTFSELVAAAQAQPGSQWALRRRVLLRTSRARLGAHDRNQN